MQVSLEHALRAQSLLVIQELGLNPSLQVHPLVSGTEPPSP